MKLVFASIALTICIVACSGGKDASYGMEEISTQEQQVFDSEEGDTVKIGDDSLEYEIIIIDPGFNIWLNSIARPRGYYGQEFMEYRNRIYVMNWNQRVIQPNSYDPQLYQLSINYDSHIDYGYEVNYMLFNYFIYFQRKYNQRLGPFYPRIN